MPTSFDVLSNDYHEPVEEQTEVGRFQSAIRNSGLTILELAMGASGPTAWASFSIFKA